MDQHPPRGQHRLRSFRDFLDFQNSKRVKSYGQKTVFPAEKNRGRLIRSAPPPSAPRISLGGIQISNPHPSHLPYPSLLFLFLPSHFLLLLLLLLLLSPPLPPPCSEHGDGGGGLLLAVPTKR